MKTPPVDQVDAMDAATFFKRLAMLMKNNPPAPADAPMVAKLASIGVVPGQPFDLNNGGSDVAKAITDGVEDGKKRVTELAHSSGRSSMDGWLPPKTWVLMGPITTRGPGLPRWGWGRTWSPMAFIRWHGWMEMANR